MRRSFSLRARTAIFIAASFAAFLTVFFVLSFLSIRSALLSRADMEVRDRLTALLSELEHSASPLDTAQLISRHGSTGEAHLRISLYQRTASGLRMSWTNDRNSPREATEEPAKFLTDRSRVIMATAAGRDLHILGVATDLHLAIATLDLVVIDEAEEAMIRQFAWLLAVGLVVSSIIGYWIAGISLAPIQLLSEGARRLAAEGKQPLDTNKRNQDQLGRRLKGLLPVPASVTEIAALADAVNQLIGDRDESIAQLRSFTADAAHELRTPLTILKGELEVELRLTKESAPIEIYRSNLEEVERLIVIVEDLLLLAKLDQEELPVRLLEISIDRSVESVLARLNSMATSRGTKLSTDLQQKLFVLADPDRFERMLYNIIHNAITYSEASGQVRIALREQGAEAELLVHNGGAVIAPEDLPYIFNRFYRAEKSRTRTSGGAGLGLSIVKSIAEQSGFQLSVHSDAKTGTEFLVRLKTADRRST